MYHPALFKLIKSFVAGLLQFWETFFFIYFLYFLYTFVEYEVIEYDSSGLTRVFVEVVKMLFYVLYVRDVLHFLIILLLFIRYITAKTHWTLIGCLTCHSDRCFLSDRLFVSLDYTDFLFFCLLQLVCVPSSLSLPHISLAVPHEIVLSFSFFCSYFVSSGWKHHAIIAALWECDIEPEEEEDEGRKREISQRKKPMNSWIWPVFC